MKNRTKHVGIISRSIRLNEENGEPTRLSKSERQNNPQQSVSHWTRYADSRLKQFGSR